MNLAFRTALLSGTRITAFSPLSLFASGEQGAWYDPSDMSTMFQDASGATAVTAVEQPVSLLLDKSKSLALGSELVTNGTFDTNITGWTSTVTSLGVFSSSWSSGAALLTRGSQGTGQFSQGISVTSGKTYKITANVTYVSGTVNANISVRSNNDAATSSGLAFQTLNTAANTTVSFYFVATSTTTVFLSAYVYSTACSFTVDNMSMVEVAGSHAYTPSTATASRPVLSARYNLLTRTEEFDNGVWVKLRTTISANTTETTDPLGGNTADKVLETLDTGVHEVYSASISPFVVGSTVSFSVYVKEAGRRYFGMFYGSAPVVVFDLTSVAVTAPQAGVTAAIVDVGNGWRRCTYTRNATATSIVPGVGTSISGTTYSGFTGDTTKGVYLWGADLRVANDGVSIPTYQRVNTSTDYDTTNFPMYLRFDGSDDYMLTGTITPGTDKAQVFAGVRKIDSTLNYGCIVELSADAGSNNGSFGLFKANSTTMYYYILRGSVFLDAVSTASFTSPITNVLQASADTSESTAAAELTAKVNAASNSLTYTNGPTAGTGNFLANPLYIGRRGGSALPFNGRLFGLIVRFGANLTDTQVSNTENWMNGKTKAY